MGAYQSRPSTEKSSSYGNNPWIEYGVSCMQGWRMSQEDAHNCDLEFDPERHASLFAVYDGHGGSEVARYCATYLPQFLRNLSGYTNKADLAETLKQLFLDFDASLTTPETRSILRNLADSDREDNQSDDDAQPNQNEDHEDEDESDSEISALRAEANQPLESVLERYGGEDALPSSIKDLLEYRRRTKVGECSTSSAASSTSTSSPDKVASSDSRKGMESSKDGETTVDNGSITTDSSKTEEAKESTDAAGADSSSTAKSGVPQKAVAQTESKTNETEVANQVQQGSDDLKSDCQEQVKAGDNALTGDDLEDEDDSDDESVQLDEDEESDSDDDGEEEESEESGSSDESGDDDDDEECDTAHRLGIPALLKEEDSEPGMDSGTTACVALVLPINGAVRLYVANAGDSRAVLCRGRAAVDLSIDHKPEDEDEKARIEAAGGTVTRDGRVNGGLNLSRALGDHNYKQTKHLSLTEQMITPTPDVTQYDLIPGSDEFVVLACDGVWNSMTSQEVVDFVYDRLHPTIDRTGAVKDGKSKDSAAVEPDGDNVSTGTVQEETSEASRLARICEEIFDHCLAPNTDGDGTGCDNMTCIIVRFKNLEALVKHAASSPSETSISQTTADSDSRKRTAAEIHRNNNASSNGIEPISSSEPDALQAKRPKHDPGETTAAVSNGSSTQTA